MKRREKNNKENRKKKKKSRTTTAEVEFTNKKEIYKTFLMYKTIVIIYT